MHELRQSTAITILIGPFLDDTDGKTPETAIDVTTINCDLYKGVTKSDLSLTASGGVNDCVHVANGYYSLELTTGNTDTLAGGRLTFNVTGSMPFWEDLMIVTTNKYDSLVLGTDKLEVDTIQLSNSAQSLLDLKDFADAGYDPATNKVQSDLIYIHGTALTETDGQLAAAFKKLFDVATPLLVASDAMQGIQPLHKGYTAMATSSTIQLAGSASSINTTYVGCRVCIVSGTGVGQSRLIRAYQGASKTCTVYPNWTTAPTSSNYEVIGAQSDMASILNDYQSAIDLKDFADAGYDPATNKVVGVLLADTCTTLTGHTAQTGDNYAQIGTAGAGLTDLGGMSTGMKGEVNDEIADVMKVDTTSEPTQGNPPTTPTFEEIWKYMYFRMMNENRETASEHSVYNAAGTTKVIKAACSDVAGTLTKEKFVSGA